MTLKVETLKLENVQ